MQQIVHQAIRLLIFCMLFFNSNSNLFAQTPSIDQLIKYTNQLQEKFEPAIQKKDFFITEQQKNNDTFFHYYKHNKIATKKNQVKDSTIRLITRANCKDTVCITYQTSAYNEFNELRNELKEMGFSCYQEADSNSISTLLYQKNDYTIKVSKSLKDSVTLYQLAIQQQLFPDPQDMFYGDDLMVFTSHEYLSLFFGAENVKKDIYYLSGNDISKCSILFANSPRQVVFLWQDEINRNGIAMLLFGGQLKTKEGIENGGYVGQSNWVLKSGIHPGMTLYELRKLHNNNFEFYGGNSAKTGNLVVDKNGNLNFTKEEITLGCVNCNDDKYARTTTLSADDALADGRIVFVLSVSLNPQIASVH
jgi:hypothetical protein